VLEKKDECSAELRRCAVWLLGRRADADAAALLITVAKSDPSIDVRTQAIDFLPRMPGDAALNAVEELLRTDPESRIQRAAVRALTSSDNPRARQSMRALIERKDANEQQRIEAIRSYDRGERATAEDAAYLRGLYDKVDNERLKEAIISTVARMGGPENEQWVLNIAKNQRESSYLRSTALSRIGTSNISVADLVKLYDAADSRSVREQLIRVFERRPDAAATDKLMEIAKTSTDNPSRIAALNALGRKAATDERAKKVLLDLVDKP
jgi:HEAT repeat protein